jgi:hypothetical protein
MPKTARQMGIRAYFLSQSNNYSPTTQNTEFNQFEEGNQEALFRTQQLASIHNLPLEVIKSIAHSICRVLD